MAKKSKPVVDLKVNPGEPLDGSGKVCIHLFIQDEKGPFVEPHVLHAATDSEGKIRGNEVVAKPTRGRLACDRKRKVAPIVRGNVITVTPRSDDPRAVTCPKCKESKEYESLMKLLGGV